MPALAAAANLTVTHDLFSAIVNSTKNSAATTGNTYTFFAPTGEIYIFIRSLSASLLVRSPSASVLSEAARGSFY